MEKMKKIVIYLWLKNNKDNKKTYNDIANKVPVDLEDVERVVTEEIQSKYCCILDEDYPNYLKTKDNLPFAIERDKIEWYEKRPRYIEKMSTKIASFIYATAVLESGDNNWCVYFDEIEERFEGMLDLALKDDKELVEAIHEELYTYNGLRGEADCVIVEEDCFDVNLWHDYRACETDLDEEED